MVEQARGVSERRGSHGPLTDDIVGLEQRGPPAYVASKFETRGLKHGTGFRV